MGQGRGSSTRDGFLSFTPRRGVVTFVLWALALPSIGCSAIAGYERASVPEDQANSPEKVGSISEEVASTREGVKRASDEEERAGDGGGAVVVADDAGVVADDSSVGDPTTDPPDDAGVAPSIDSAATAKGKPQNVPQPAGGKADKGGGG